MLVEVFPFYAPFVEAWDELVSKYENRNLEATNERIKELYEQAMQIKYGETRERDY